MEITRPPSRGSSTSRSKRKSRPSFHYPPKDAGLFAPRLVALADVLNTTSDTPAEDWRDINLSVCRHSMVLERIYRYPYP